MDCFWGKIIESELVMKEAEVAKWLLKEELHSVEFVPADAGILDKIKSELK